MKSLVSSLGVQKFEVILPASKRRVEYRPFLVKEEKVLLVAAESKNEKEIFQAMKDVVSSCTFESVDVENCAIIDIEYLFLKIRSKSVGETANPSIKCNNCNKVSEVKVDVSKVEPIYDSNHKAKIVINENIVLEMRYPKFSDLELVEQSTNDLDKAVCLLTCCIDKIQTKDEVFNSKEVERSELDEFVSCFTQEQLRKAMSFIETMPKLSTNVNFECSHCRHKEIMHLEGVKDFF